MKFLVVGCGSIGQRHICNLKSMTNNHSIDIFDENKKIATSVALNSKVNLVDKDAIRTKSYDCVFICTPPSNHVDTALEALSSGSNIFIEKPLSSNFFNVKKLQNIVTKNNLLVFVGYNFRFNKGINTIKNMISEKKFGNILYASAYFGQYLPDWRPHQDYKKSYTANKKLGGGIILDDSHEINYLVWLLGKPESIISNYVFTNFLSTNTEGIADVILKFSNKVLGHIHMDYVRREYKRTLELVCERGIIEWSLSKSEIDMYDAMDKKHSKLKLYGDVNDMYVQEIKHVLDCIKRKKRSKIIDLDDGVYTLELSDYIRKAGLSGKRIEL